MSRRNYLSGKYKLNAAELLHVLGYVRMYKQWLDEYNSLADMNKAIRYDRDKVQNMNEDPVFDHATRMAALSSRIGLIESSAIESDCEIYQWILKSIRENLSLDAMRKQEELKGTDLPFSHNKFYGARRKFYYLVSLKIK